MTLLGGADGVMAGPRTSWPRFVSVTRGAVPSLPAVTNHRVKNVCLLAGGGFRRRRESRLKRPTLVALAHASRMPAFLCRAVLSGAAPVLGQWVRPGNLGAVCRVSRFVSLQCRSQLCC